MKDFQLPYRYDFANMTFHYPAGSFGPKPELRWLDDIRASLRQGDCDGPEIVYSIAMDVGFETDREDLRKRNLLYGTVIYNSGRLGNEPIRSQGHVHAVSASCGSSTAELYEVHSGVGIIYMQESAGNQPGRCFAVRALPGELVLVPPAWAHMTISADPQQPLSFGAWCVRHYGFEYSDVRAHRGLAWFPLLDDQNEISWQANPNYQLSEFVEKAPEDYSRFGIEQHKSIYQQYREEPGRFDFIPRPHLASHLWQNFVP